MSPCYRIILLSFFVLSTTQQTHMDAACASCCYTASSNRRLTWLCLAVQQDTTSLVPMSCPTALPSASSSSSASSSRPSPGRGARWAGWCRPRSTRWRPALPARASTSPSTCESFRWICFAHCSLLVSTLHYVLAFSPLLVVHSLAPNDGTLTLRHGCVQGVHLPDRPELHQHAVRHEVR